MADPQQLSLSNVVAVTVVLSQPPLGNVNINTAALITQDEPQGWAEGQVYAIYTDANGVATDFGADSDAAKIATFFFAQQPNPISTGGYLAVIPRLTDPALETVQAAILRTLNKVFYFGILIDEEMDNAPEVFASLTAYVQTLDKMLFYASSNVADLEVGSILDLVRQAAQSHVRCLYSGDATLPNTQCFAGAYAGRALSTEFDGSATASTMHLKTLTNCLPDPTIDQTLLNKAEAAGVDVYVDLSGLIGLFTSGANTFFDLVYNALWFKFAIQIAGVNYLAGTQFKIPQTESGMDGLKNAYAAICDQAVVNGFAAPGAWSSATVFGVPADLIRNVKDFGYYVWSKAIAKQNAADRAARKAPLVQIALKAAGAIHQSSVLVTVNP